MQKKSHTHTPKGLKFGAAKPFQQRNSQLPTNLTALSHDSSLPTIGRDKGKELNPLVIF
jgi:hypothetical protein